jgi:hypothetical protein
MKKNQGEEEPLKHKLTKKKTKKVEGKKSAEAEEPKVLIYEEMTED